MSKPKSTIVDVAYAWSQFARENGCRFDVERKAAEAVTFTIQAKGRTFAIPSKLEGVKESQRTLLQMQEAMCRERWQLLSLFEDGDQVLGLWEGVIIGRIRSKHLKWLRPLLDTSAIVVYVSEITGGGEKGLYGCNVVFAGIGDALDVLYSEPDALAIAA